MDVQNPRHRPFAKIIKSDKFGDILITKSSLKPPAANAKSDNHQSNSNLKLNVLVAHYDDINHLSLIVNPQSTEALDLLFNEITLVQLESIIESEMAEVLSKTPTKKTKDSAEIIPFPKH